MARTRAPYQPGDLVGATTLPTEPIQKNNNHFVALQVPRKFTVVRCVWSEQYKSWILRFHEFPNEEWLANGFEKIRTTHYAFRTKPGPRPVE